MSRQLAGGLGKQPGRQWETPGDNARYQGLNLHMPLGNSKCVAWCRQGSSLSPPPRDGVPVCAHLRLGAPWDSPCSSTDLESGASSFSGPQPGHSPAL